MSIAFLSAAKSVITRASTAGSLVSCFRVRDVGYVIRCPSRIGGLGSVEPLALHVGRHGVRHQVSHRLPRGSAAPDQRAGDVEPRHVEEADALGGARET